MRNILKASSAVAFAALFVAGSALAQDAKKEEEEVKKAEATEMAEAPAEEMTEEAMAEEVMEEAPPPAWTVGISGYMEQWVGMTDADGHATQDGVTDVRSDTEFNVNAKMVADNGLTFRAEIQVEGNAPAGVDESYLSISGGFGDIRLGAEDEVHAAMHYGVKDVGIGLNAGDVNAWIPVTSPFSTSRWTADRKGIVYFSPRMQGVQIGLGYAGSTKNEAASATNNDEDSWSAAVNYQGEMAGTTIALSLGHYNANTVGEQTYDEDGRTHICGLTRSGVADAGPAGFSAFNNIVCDPARNATTNVDTEKGTYHLGGTVGTPDGNGTDDHFIPAASMAKMADSNTATNFGVQVGVGSFGVSFAYAQADNGAYKVQKTPLYYQLWDATNTAANTNPTAVQKAAVARQVAHVLVAPGAATTATAPLADGTTKPRTVPKGTAGAISGAEFNWNDKKMDSLTCPATGTGACNDAQAANLVPEHTESVVKDKAGESTTMSAGVSFTEGPLGVSLAWTKEERDDDTEADAVMFSASYTLAPGVAARASIFQAEDDHGGTNIDGSGVVAGITLSF